MHHPDPAGDSGSVRKMPHPAVFHRRGSNTSSGSGSTLSTTANPVVVNNSHVSGDDYQSSLLIQPPAASSSPGPHHPPPPHSLNLQPQPAQPTGAQIKKKSGFQITSVTPAQISVSTNNSIAEDTESYDDLDESHTEDLSSSEILDVSLSRANDVVGAERSSSEETLNNFHEAETPGAVSPNQPSHPHTLTHAQHRGGAIVNGTMHHQHPHHLNHAQSYSLTGDVPSLTQKMPSNVGGAQENVSHATAATPSIVSQSAGIVTPGSVPGMHSSVSGTTVSVVNPPTSSFSNVNMLSSANVPVRGGIKMSASSGGAGGSFPPKVISSTGGSSAAAGGSHMSAANVNINSMTTTTAAAAVSASGGVGVPSGIQGRVGSAASAPAAAVPSAVPAPVPAVTAATSRFRVVKLDSSSEPFKKGRWTCTEFFDKDAPTPAPSASEAASLTSRQFVTENFPSERESTSSSSVSSTMSTLSHYIENLGSGEGGGSPVPQHAQDYASPPQGYQGIMGVPHSQAHMHTQDINHPHVKTTAAPSVSPNLHLPGQQTATGAVLSQQLTYAQAVANQPPSSSQGLVGIQQQKMGYANLPQQSAASPASARPPGYNQSQQGVLQAAPSQPLSNQSGSVLAAQANGATQMMGGPQQSQGLLHKPVPVSSMPPHVGVAGLGQHPPSHVDIQQQKPQSLLTQTQNPGSSTQLPPAASASTAPPTNAHSDHQPQAHNAANVGRMSPHPSQDLSSAQALVHAAQASALYASLPSFTTTQLQDAQRLLLQHQSLLKLSGSEAGSNTGLGQETEGNANTASALAAPAGLKTVDGEDDGSSGASVVAIDNKIEQAMDLVKSHLMYAVREEVEVLKEQIKELIERNSQLEQENTLLKTLASPEQMAQFQAQVQTGSPPAPQTAAPSGTPSAAAASLAQPASHSAGPSA
ncbi:TSC22 domain family protein 1-like isoform X1 [Gambusia affinis]|uniref:TSC22 domain family protein 1-like isoform X1 n=1 Tax=Gambusia affinis TaxID=33528 RepID=UPI001CDC006D|nr:TSC22 domain family protein 1-like isoform X1 [Gambusia affinis]